VWRSSSFTEPLTLTLPINRGLADAANWFVNGGLADVPSPLTPTLSLGEREKTIYLAFMGSTSENSFRRNLSPSHWERGI
jgi:hypothetical protein